MHQYRRQAKRPRRFEIDHQLELCRLLDEEVGRLRARRSRPRICGKPLARFQMGTPQRSDTAHALNPLSTCFIRLSRWCRPSN
jgi:hypothetical protein